MPLLSQEELTPPVAVQEAALKGVALHELGHYAFGLYDEYKGETEPGALASRLAEQTDL